VLICQSEFISDSIFHLNIEISSL